MLLPNISSPVIHEMRVRPYCQLSSFTEVIGEKVPKLSSIFLKMSSNDVMQINLANYIEHVVYTILREELIIQLPFFLKQCFVHDSQ